MGKEEAKKMTGRCAVDGRESGGTCSSCGPEPGGASFCTRCDTSATILVLPWPVRAPSSCGGGLGRL